MRSNTQILLVLLTRSFLSQSCSSHFRNHCSVPFWFQTNQLSSQLLFLQISYQRFPSESRFACKYILCDTLAHSVGCSHSGDALQTALGFWNKNHIGTLREFYQNYSPDVQIYHASWIVTIPTAARYRATLYVAQEQELFWSTTFPLHSPNKARLLQSSFADCYRSTAAA